MSRRFRGFDPAALTVGRARSEDVKFIKGLVTEKTSAYFGPNDVEDLLRKCYLSLVVKHKTEGVVVGAACFSNHPNVPSIAPWCWEEWVESTYGLKRVHPENTLWVHLVVHAAQCALVFLKPLLKYVFARCRYVEQVLFVFPPGLRIFDWLENFGTQIVPEGFENISEVQTLFMVLRQHHVVPYKIRRAVAQDNDDVVALLDERCPRLTELYGEYYIAEIITYASPERQIIIAEYDGRAVAVLGLATFVNYDLLNAAFKLETFYGLRKPDERDSIKDYYEGDLDTGQKATTDLGDVITKKYQMLHLMEPPRPPDSSKRGSFKDETTGAFPDTYHVFSSEDDLVLCLDLSFFSLANSDVDLVSAAMTPSERKISGMVVESYLKSKLSCLVLTHKAAGKRRWSRGKEKLLNMGFVPEGQTARPKVARYHGEANAFAIELFAAEKGHEDALPLILEGAFECYPRRDYCVCSIPSTEMNLPLFKLCVRAVPRPTSNFHHELYAAHRSATHSRVTVRGGTPTDVSALENLLRDMRMKQEVLPVFIRTLRPDETKYASYVFLCGDELVGFAVVSEEEDVSYLKTHYKIHNLTDLSGHKLGQHGAMDYFVLSPIFQKHTLFLLLELHRLSDYSILYFKLHPKELLHDSLRILPAALCALLPVLPAKLPDYDFIKEESEWALRDVLKMKQKPFALYISTPTHCGLPRFEVNTKIVVVGGSDVGISFLINLLFGRSPNYKLTFNNVTLVSPHGVGRNVSNEVRNLLLQNAGDYTTEFLTLLSLRTYINIVNGVMSHINRKEKYITVNNTSLPYDLLFLMCGRQYQMPLLEKYAYQRLCFPINVMVINTEIDADAAILRLEGFLNKRADSSCKNIGASQISDTIIVYGCTLDAFCCLSALLELGIPGSNIAFVEPEIDQLDHRTIFNDDDISNAVLNSIREQDVKLHHGYTLTEWEVDFDENTIKSATFQCLHNQMTIACLAMFAYTPKTISSRTFVAVHHAGLILDGSLVVGPDGSTNDPCVYAAGTMTKYPRRYYADHMKHEYFNRKEIGRGLAQLILEKLVPEIHEPDEDSFTSHCAKSKNLVPQYEQPLTTYCVLPGKLRYLNVRKPGLQVPLEIALDKDDYGQVLISGNLKNLQAQGYFRLHLNQFNSVETITCLTRCEISKVNIEALWGKHESLLNHLVKRFELVKIPDLLEFFGEPWSCALAHDKFADLQKECIDVMSSLAVNPNESIIEDLLDRFRRNKWHRLSKEERAETMKKFKGSEYCAEVEGALFKFLAENDLCLPMYAPQPGALKVILANSENSPAFSET